MASAIPRIVTKRLLSTATVASAAPCVAAASVATAARRVALFEAERRRQLELLMRIEKVELKHMGPGQRGATLIMNRGLSTPYNCAQHLSEWFQTRSVLASIDGEIYDMYRPLERGGPITFLTFKDEDATPVNEAYWRSCALMLGSALSKSFKEEFPIELIGSPEVPVISGAFCYDVLLDARLDAWVPTEDNLRSITREVHLLIKENLPFERLSVDASVALDMFSDSGPKVATIEEKASKNEERKVTLYKLGDFVEVSDGPHIPRTGFCFHYDVTAAHALSPPAAGEAPQPDAVAPARSLRRFQGVSLPWPLKTHHVLWSRLVSRSRKLVTEGRKETEEVAVASSPAEPSTAEPSTAATTTTTTTTTAAA